MASRYAARRKAGTRSRDLGKQNEGELVYQDVMAAAAERYVARIFGADETTIDSRRPDRGWDLVLPVTGRTVDVKWTRWTPGRRFGGGGVAYPTLNLSTWKRGIGRCDLYVLVMGEAVEDFDTYRWAIGYATRDELLSAPVTSGRVGRPYHALGFDYLHSIEELYDEETPW